MKAEKINLCNTLISQLGETYRLRKGTLNPLEKLLYETALRISVKELAPRAEAIAAIEDYDCLLRELRERAEAARTARAARKDEPKTDAV